jgi:SOS-response transcriptional repressor LexA
MLIRNAAAVSPSLHSGMIAMAQLAGHRTNAAAFSDDFCIGHDADVRTMRTHVNVENVRTGCDEFDMPTIGEKLIALKDEADVSLDIIAKAGGYAGRSGVQRFFDREFDGPLSPKVAKKLAAAFVQRGVPEATFRELATSGFETNASPFALEGASMDRMIQDLPVYGTALGAERVLEGQAIEQASLNTVDIIEYKKRPTILNGRNDVYGLYMQGNSMDPLHADGSIVLAERKRPPRSGDSVVVYLRSNGEGDLADDGESARMVMVKRLVKRTAHFVELFQFEPIKTFRVPMDDVLRIDRVLTLDDLLD